MNARIARVARAACAPTFQARSAALVRQDTSEIPRQSMDASIRTSVSLRRWHFAVRVPSVSTRLAVTFANVRQASPATRKPNAKVRLKAVAEMVMSPFPLFHRPYRPQISTNVSTFAASIRFVSTRWAAILVSAKMASRAMLSFLLVVLVRSDAFFEVFTTGTVTFLLLFVTFQISMSVRAEMAFVERMLCVSIKLAPSSAFAKKATEATLPKAVLV